MRAAVRLLALVAVLLAAQFAAADAVYKRGSGAGLPGPPGPSDGLGTPRTAGALEILDADTAKLVWPLTYDVVTSPTGVTQKLLCPEYPPPLDFDDPHGDVNVCELIIQAGTTGAGAQEIVRQLNYNFEPGVGFKNPFVTSFQKKHELGFIQGAGGIWNEFQEENLDVYTVDVSHVPTNVTGTFQPGESVTFTTGAATDAKARVIGICTGGIHGTNGIEAAADLDRRNWCSELTTGGIPRNRSQCDYTNGAVCSAITPNGTMYLQKSSEGDQSSNPPTISGVAAGDTFVGDISGASADAGTLTRLSASFTPKRIRHYHHFTEQMSTRFGLDTNHWRSGQYRGQVGGKDEFQVDGNRALFSQIDLTVQNGSGTINRNYFGGNDVTVSVPWGLRVLTDYTERTGFTPEAVTTLSLQQIVRPETGLATAAKTGVSITTSIVDTGKSPSTWSGPVTGLEFITALGSGTGTKPVFRNIYFATITGVKGPNLAHIQVANMFVNGSNQNFLDIEPQSGSGLGGHIRFQDTTLAGAHLKFGTGSNKMHLGVHDGVLAFVEDDGADQIPNNGDDPYNLRKAGLWTTSASNPVNGTNKCLAARPVFWLNTTSGKRFKCGTTNDTWVSISDETVCKTIYAPVTTIGNTDDLPSIYRSARPVTVTEVWCESDQTATTMQLQKDDGSPVEMLSSDLACDGTPTTAFVSGENVLAAGDRIDYHTEAISGSPTRVTFCAEITRL